MIRIITLAMLIALCSLSKPVIAQNAADDGHGKPGVSTEQVESFSLEESVTGDRAPHDYKNHPCYKPVSESDRADCSDLYQQWRMAVATEGMDFTAWLQFIVATFALLVSVYVAFLIRDTLRATEKLIEQAENTTREANRSASAAESAVAAALKANETQRELGEAQVRAYLGIENPEFFLETRNECFAARATCRNFGNSPSLYTRLVCMLDVSYDTDPGSGEKIRSIEGKIATEAYSSMGGIDIPSQQGVEISTYFPVNAKLPREQLGERFENFWGGRVTAAVVGVDVFGKLIFVYERFNIRLPKIDEGPENIPMYVPFLVEPDPVNSPITPEERKELLRSAAGLTKDGDIPETRIIEIFNLLARQHTDWQRKDDKGKK